VSFFVFAFMKAHLVLSPPPPPSPKEKKTQSSKTRQNKTAQTNPAQRDIQKNQKLTHHPSPYQRPQLATLDNPHRRLRKRKHQRAQIRQSPPPAPSARAMHRSPRPGLPRLAVQHLHRAPVDPALQRLRALCSALRLEFCGARW